jgi:hypothetical protein
VKSQKIAEMERDPTPGELTSLLRLMEFDSPEGEMKYEARAIWREMRSRKVFPTEQGYLALLRVTRLIWHGLIVDCGEIGRYVDAR